MKITDIEVLRMQAHAEPTNNWLFVRIHTDAASPASAKAACSTRTPRWPPRLKISATYLRGKDPSRSRHIWTSLHRRVTWTGGAVTISAISAIDLALWDIKGKALGVPVYELIGGKVRDRVPLYANGWFAGDEPSAHGPQEGATGEQEWYADTRRRGGGQGLSLSEDLPLSAASRSSRRSG